MRRSWFGLAAAAALVVCAPASAQPLEEYDVKAAFLYRFTHFVEWPDEAFASADSPLSLCIVGHDPFEGTLAQIVAGESVGGHPLEVRQVADPSRAEGCHLVFLSRWEDPAWVARLPDGGAARRLTVGETGEFLAEGGLMRFDVRGGRVRLEVSRSALERTELRISSKLLNLADLVDPGS